MKINKKNLIIYAAGILAVIAGFFLDNYVAGSIGNLKNAFLDIFLGWVTNFANIFVILIFMTTLFLWEERKREWIPVLWLSYAVAIGISFIMKFLIARPRIIGEFYYPMTNIASYSFPSMHTIAAFAAIPILDKEFPMFKWFWMVFALLVAFSRVYFNLHYLYLGVFL